MKEKKCILSLKELEEKKKRHLHPGNVITTHSTFCAFMIERIWRTFYFVYVMRERESCVNVSKVFNALGFVKYLTKLKCYDLICVDKKFLQFN